MDPRIYAAVAAVAVAFGAGWLVNGWRLDTKLSELRAEHSASVVEAQRVAINAQRALDDKRDALATALAGVDAEGLQKLRDDANETNRLRSCIADGTCGLRIAATCPTAPTVVPGNTAGRRVDSGTGPRLTADAESAYFALRDGLASTQAKLGACQESVRRITGQ